MNPKMQELRDNLKLAKQDYKAAVKARKKAYKEDKKNLKGQMKALRHKKKAAKPAPIPQPEGPTFLNKCDHAKDSVLLTMCEPFEAKAQAIRYKRLDPNGYEADMVVHDSIPVIKFYEKRVNKGKQLKSRDVDVLIKLSMTLDVIQDKEMGFRFQEAHKLMMRCSELISPSSEEELAAVEKMMDRFDSMFGSLVPAGA